MPPECEITETEETIESVEPHPILEHVSQIREDFANGLKPNDGEANYNVEQNIIEIRAILATNSGISDRCNTRMHHSSYIRCSFDVVETFADGATTQFVTYPKRGEKSFDMTPLVKLPAALDNVFFFRLKPFTNFIDFEALFERSLILHDDVLGPFLANLKDHLMSVQVCLGEVETWIMEPKQLVNYLETTFDVEMDMPKENEVLVKRTCDCPSGTHSDSLVCLGCRKTLGQHDSNMSCNPSYYASPFFSCRKFQLLKKYTNNFPGKIETAFKIAEENDKRKLEKLIEFMEMD